MSPLAGLRHIVASHTQMSSARPDPSFPAVPGTLNAGDHELQDRYIVDRETDMAHNTAPDYTPYLGLRARLSQVWINKWTILLLLILCRVLLAIQGLDHNIASAKTQALSACTSVENVGSAMASMPHYMSGGVNAMAASGVTKAVAALMDMLMLTITGVEEIALFIINLLTSTYVCLITLVVDGALHAALEVIDKAGEFLNKTISAVTGEISGGLSSFQDELNGFIEGVSDVSGFFGASKTLPSVDFTSQINKLNGITLDADVLDSDLKKLSDNIPDFEQVHNFTNNMIRAPFELIKKLINESTTDYTFDQSVFPVAQKQALSFCSNNNGINSFFDGLSATANTARKIFIGVIIALAVLACVPMAYREIRRWRTMQQRALLVQRQAFDPMDVIYLASRPYTSTAGIKVASKFQTTKKQILTRWFVAYITSVPALFVLLLAMAGLLSCLMQYILLRTIQREVPALANQVGEFSGTVVLALKNASEQWAVGANGVVTSTNTKINGDVFGWVNTSTTAVNDTLNMFVDMVQTTLNDTFGGTVLYTPIQETLKCLIFLKIEGISKGLTWVHDHAHVAFPLFDKNVFSLGAAASLSDSDSADSFLASPGSEATDDITGAVQKVVRYMEKTIREEALISTALLGVYVLIVLIGLGRMIAGMAARDKTRAEGGPTYTTGAATGPAYMGERHTGLSPRHTGEVAKFPAFGGDSESADSKHSGGQGAWAAGGVEGEKVGHAPQRSVGAVEGQAHERKSSYGFVGEKS